MSVPGYWKWYRCINVSQHLINWVRKCVHNNTLVLWRFSTWISICHAWRTLQFIGFGSLTVNLLQKNNSYKPLKRLSLGFEREVISVCETVVGPYTLEAVVRCSKTLSSLSWQSAVLAYAKPGRNWPTVWIKMFHLLRTLRDHTYFAGLY